MNKRAIILRGVSGSGKSTLAHSLCVRYWDAGLTADYFEADRFFVNKNGVYEFDHTKLGAAHKWCLDSFVESLGEDDLTIASNTFTTKKELRPYVEACAKAGIMPQIVTVEGVFGDVHNVPVDVKVRQQARFDYRAGNELLAEYFLDVGCVVYE